MSQYFVMVNAVEPFSPLHEAVEALFRSFEYKLLACAPERMAEHILAQVDALNQKHDNVPVGVLFEAHHEDFCVIEITDEELKSGFECRMYLMKVRGEVGELREGGER